MSSLIKKTLFDCPIIIRKMKNRIPNHFSFKFYHIGATEKYKPFWLGCVHKFIKIEKAIELYEEKVFLPENTFFGTIDIEEFNYWTTDLKKANKYLKSLGFKHIATQDHSSPLVEEINMYYSIKQLKDTIIELEVQDDH